MEAEGPSLQAGHEKRKWIPKAEYKKLTGTEAKRDDKWRPGGEHQDPRQKYKDAKKAKWTPLQAGHPRAREEKTVQATNAGARMPSRTSCLLRTAARTLARADREALLDAMRDGR